MLPTENHPDRLVEICLEQLSLHLELVAGAALPRELCEALLNIHTAAGRPIDAVCGAVFSDTQRTSLRRVCVREQVCRSALHSLLQHKLTHLDMSRCTSPPPALLQLISSHGENLIELSLGSWKKLEHYPGGFSNSPKLKKLEIYKWHDFGNALTLPLLLSPLKELVCLNLSGAFGVKDLSCLASLPHLRRLFLYKVNKHNLEGCNGISTIRQLTNLTHLDISGSEAPYPAPDTVLASIVDDLPHLVYLDISETNLAGRGEH